MADPVFACVLVGSAIGGAGFSAFLIGYTTLLQRSTTTELQGRVFTAAEATAGVPYTAMLGLAVLGIGLVDYRVMLVASTLVPALAGAYLGRGAPRARGPAHSGTAQAPPPPAPGSHIA